MGFFSLKELDKKYQLNLFDHNTWRMLIINGERNCGKTTSVLKDVLEKVNKENKIVFLKHTEVQMKTFIADFNQRFEGLFRIVNNSVYELIAKFKKSKGSDIEEIIYSLGDHVGYIGCVNTYQNSKSVEAKNIRWIIFDEYNMIDNLKNFFEKFLNLIKTFERFNKITFILIGNRDTPNNELMVRLELLPDQAESPKIDRVTEFMPGGYFIELGTEQFKDLNNEQTLSGQLAKFDKNTRSYMEEGKYLIMQSMIVVPFRKRIKDSFDPLFLVSFDEKIGCLGRFNNGQYLALCINEDAVSAGESEHLLNISINNMGWLNVSSIINSKDESDKIIALLLNAYKNNELFFDSFETLEFFKKRASLITNF